MSRQLGKSQDTRIIIDATNSVVQNDKGISISPFEKVFDKGTSAKLIGNAISKASFGKFVQNDDTKKGALSQQIV